MSRILHVILTGGVGSRLWPLSRRSRPKQYLNIFSDHSLFELAVKRNTAFTDGLIVVGNQGNRQLSEAGLHKLGITGYTNIVEATPRNTAPAIAFAAFASQPEDILLVTPADHIIKEGPDYSTAIEKALELAKEDNIVTFGIQPTKPETGFGYIEYKENEVIAFREKPNIATAQDFIETGNFLWNSGMFCFKAEVFLEELKKQTPKVYQKSSDAFEAASDNQLDETTSSEIQSISVDYAVMEKSDRIKVVASGFEWSDMGSFEAVYDYLKDQGHPVDEAGNMVIGSDIYTAFIGLKDSILILTEDANLVLQKEVSQDVKKIYQTLESANSPLIE